MLELLLLRPALLCLSTCANAVQAEAPTERWTLVHSEPGIAYYLDERTVSTQGSSLTYWILIDFDYGPKYDGAKPYKSARLLHALTVQLARKTPSHSSSTTPQWTKVNCAGRQRLRTIYCAWSP